jgi:hypothetical protein
MIQISHQAEKPDAVFMWTRMAGVFIWAIVMGIITLGLKIYYIIHVINNKLIDQTERIVWVLVFIFFGIVGYPAYWISRVWNTRDNSSATS